MDESRSTSNDQGKVIDIDNKDYENLLAQIELAERRKKQPSNNLAKIRKKHGLTQDELSLMIGTSKQGLSFNETGKISLRTAKAVSEALQENIFEILGEDVLVALPKTKEDREAVLRTVRRVISKSIGAELAERK